MALAVDDSNFDDIVIKSDKPVLVDFWAEWCGPCRMIAPLVEEISADFEGRVVVTKCDVDNSAKSMLLHWLMCWCILHSAAPDNQF